MPDTPTTAEPAPALYLASGSPRRGELLTQLGLAWERLPAPVPETVRPGEAATAFVERLARAKAAAGLERRPAGDRRPVLGADTALDLDGEILGKPAGPADARAMLERLAGRSHRVLSGVAVADGERTATAVCTTEVRLRALRPGEAEAYWATGEPVDKAGGYAIQGRGAVLVESIRGSYSGVMGLPLFETAGLLAGFGIDVLDG